MKHSNAHWWKKTTRVPQTDHNAIQKSSKFCKISKRRELWLFHCVVYINRKLGHGSMIVNCDEKTCGDFYPPSCIRIYSPQCVGYVLLADFSTHQRDLSLFCFRNKRALHLKLNILHWIFKGQLEHSILWAILSMCADQSLQNTSLW